MFSFTGPFFGALPLGHPEQGRTGTVLVHVVSHLYATLPTLGCNLWDATERECQHRWMDQPGSSIASCSFLIQFVGMLHCSDVMLFIIAPM